MSQVKKGCLGLAAFLLLVAAFPFVWRSIVHRQNEDKIFDVQSAPQRPVAIVYGAAIFRGDHLSSILRDRMDTALKLYEDGLVEAILVSGDRRDDSYDEPGAMAEYAKKNGVPTEDIIIDEDGKRTFDTCYRARNIFEVQSAVLVTQAFHLPRALFTCNQLGLDSVGVVADRRPYRGAQWYKFRETAATVVALFDIVNWKSPVFTVVTGTAQLNSRR